MKPFLRKQEPNNSELKAQYQAHAKELQDLPEDAPQRFLELLCLLGSEAMRLNLLDDAKPYLENALNLSRQSHQIQAELSVRLLLAQCLQYLEEIESADEQFQKALKMTLEPSLIERRDTVLHGWGQFLAEQGKYDVAQTCFREALKLRTIKADPSLILESEDALELVGSLGIVNDEGYAVIYTEISHIEVPESAGPILD